MNVPAPIIVVPADPGWPAQFREIAGPMRRALGPVAQRIDHVGSTSVAGLDAKPVIDIAVSVASLEPLAAFRDPLVGLGYRFRPENPDRSKRYFDGPPGGKAVHIHVRPLGSLDEQLTLVFRDYLRAHPPDAAEYARVKWDLAERFRNDREGYVRAKQPTVWSILLKAHDWAQATAWSPGPSDA